jgi:hypothetical protein
LESWDPKPRAPAEVRGEFADIATATPGLRIGEHLPRLAKLTPLYNTIRSVYMDNARRDHSPGLHWVLTGWDNQAAGVGLEKVNHSPSVGSVICHQLGAFTRAGLPNFIAIPTAKQLGNRVRYTGAKHLGAACEPYDSGPVPSKSTDPFQLPTGLVLPRDMSPSRLRDRQDLLSSLKTLNRNRRRLDELGGIGDFQRTAYELLAGRRGQQAFDLNREPRAMRERYGDSEIGQGTLLARRLVEAGAHYVLVNYSKNNSWDTHRDNFKRLKNTLLPPTDQAVAALLTDLEERGMLDETLVVLMGEMGRTPKINKNAGRDHWPDVFSLLMAGGGLTRGQVLGASSRFADTPAERPIHYHEVLATIYRQLGIDASLVFVDEQAQPKPVMPDADCVHELIA